MALPAEKAFPARPTLPLDTPCDGLALVLPPDAPSPNLSEIRNQVKALWRGSLDTTADAPHVVVIEFAAPILAPLDATASGLPLCRTASGELASYADKQADPLGAAPKGDAAAARWLRLWWNGRPSRLPLETLDRIPVADLWGPPRITIHEPAVTSMAAAESPPRGGSEHSSADQPVDGGLAKVGHAKLETLRTAGDPIAHVDDALRSLEERTKLSAIFRQAVAAGRRRLAGGGAGAAAEGPGRPPEPGVLENLMGWVRWHTPLGDGLRRKFSERQRLVEKLLASGDLDSALKMALSLGGGQQGAGRKPYPASLPTMRTSLDLRFDGPTAAAPILHNDAYAALQARYRQLAQQLEQKRDHQRAAYVYTKLLNDHRQAVLVLERGELYAEAAKLAYDAKLEPTLTIRLLFKAGDLTAALALAKRAGCFEELAEESRGKEGAFHAYVIAAWTEALIATGQPLRAIQVTDLLAGAKDAPRPLLDARRRWLAAALEQTDGAAPSPELFARGLLMSSWSELSKDVLEEFPRSAPPSGGGVQALTRGLAAVLRGESEDPPRELVELLPVLDRLANPSLPEQASFWRISAQPVVEAFILGVIERAGNRLTAREIGASRSLLDKADLPVLAHDLRTLGKLYGPPSSKPRIWRAPPATSTAAPARTACVLDSGQVLAWRSNRLIELFDRNGAVLWRQTISDVVGLVPVGASPNVIIIQRQVDGTALLTRFATHRRTFHTIGKVRLAAWHDVSSEGQWMVQIGGEIGALDLVKLCASTPEIEFLWSSQLTDRLQAIAFGHAPERPQWLTRDVSEGRYGVLELWTFTRTGDLTTSICIPSPASDGDETRGPEDWAWTPGQAAHSIWTSSAARDRMAIGDWTIDQERRATGYAARRDQMGLEGRDVFQVCDFGRPFLRLEEGPLMRVSVMPPSGQAPLFILEHLPTQRVVCLARGVSGGFGMTNTPGALVFADDDGRLFLVDMQSLNVVAM